MGSGELLVLNAVRFIAAVLIGAAAFGALMPGMPAFELLSKASLLYVLSLVLVALVIGLVVTRRGWLAAATAYVLGIALWIVIYLRPSPPWALSDNWHVETWLYIVGSGLAGALLFACIAYIGSSIARLVVRAWHRNDQALRMDR